MTTISTTFRIDRFGPGLNINFCLGLISILVLLTLTSCGVFHKMDKYEAQWSADQASMIMVQDGAQPMRVFETTRRSDSLLLRQKSAFIHISKGDSILNRLSDRLLATVRDSMSLGVGIAAPQIGILKQMIWVQRFDKEGFPFEVYLNPIILNYSAEKQSCTEGCLSIPDKKGDSGQRAQSIQLRYQNLQGQEFEEVVEGFTAVIFQHEIDHLNGILFIDYL